MAALDPELEVAARAMAATGARFVVVGGFAVIANRFIRATDDIDFLVPDSRENDLRITAALLALKGVRDRDDAPIKQDHLTGRAHLRARTEAGVIDIIRGGLPPLDYETVESRAMTANYGDIDLLVANLQSIVGFKRLADRPQDRNDLLGLERVHGALPVEPIPGVDER